MVLKILSNKNITNNIHSLTGNVIQALLGFVSFLIIVRYTSKENFGLWVIFITVSTLMDMFRLGLTGMATIRLLALDKNTKAVGSSYQLSIIATLITGGLFGIVYLLCYWKGFFTEYLFIFKMYPLLALSNIPFYQATIVAQGESAFYRLSIVKTLNAVFILVFLALYILLEGSMPLLTLVWIYIGANSLTSMFSFLKKWDGFQFLRHGDRFTRKSILKFGKYSTASYISSNLLKSSDTFILGASAQFGPEAVAIFAIPFKFVEIIEVIIRSFASTAFPKFTQSLKTSFSSFMSNLVAYTGITSLILIPAVFLLAFFPDFFLMMLGGDNYLKDLEVQKRMLYLICIYILILPSDRFTGVALFSLDRGKENFYKIISMLVMNIVFDLLAVFVFKSLVMVAFATVVFTFLGVVIGWAFIHRIAIKEYDGGFQLLNLFGQFKGWIQFKEILTRQRH